MKKISYKLMAGIISIVLISGVIVGLLYFTQYKKYSINLQSDIMVNQANEISAVSQGILTSRMRDREYMALLRMVNRIADSELYITDNNGKVILNTNESGKLLSFNEINEIIRITANGKVYKSQAFENSHYSVAVPVKTPDGIVGSIILVSKLNDINTLFNKYTTILIVGLLVSTGLAVILTIIYSKYFTKPIEKICLATQKIGEGDYSTRTGVNQEDEIGDVAKSIDMLASNMKTKIEEVQKLESMSKEFVANVSHEFKTPLTLIMAYIDSIKDGIKQADNNTLDKIYNHAHNLEKMVNELLDLNRLQSGKVVINIEEVFVNETMDNIIEEMQSIANEKNIKIEADFVEEKLVINCDEKKLKQLIIILIDNAIKYSNNNIVKFKLSKNEIIIEDNGIGIEKEDLEHIFDRFYKGNKARDEKGHGLGLCLAKHLAEVQGFEIKVESELEVGTKVTIVLQQSNLKF